MLREEKNLLQIQNDELFSLEEKEFSLAPHLLEEEEGATWLAQQYGWRFPFWVLSGIGGVRIVGYPRFVSG